MRCDKERGGAWKIDIWVMVVLCALGVLLMNSCSREGGAGKAAVEPQVKVIYGYFDTVSMLYSYAGDEAERFEENAQKVTEILRDYHKLFDIYNQYEGMNNLCTVNQMAGGEPVKVDERLIEFLVFAKKMCEVTDGKMDVMMGAVTQLWHDARENGRLPENQAIVEAAQHVGIELLEIDEENSTVRILDSKASIDVGAIGKGYATEVAARYLSVVGATGYVLNTGGNVRCVGTKADGSAWSTGIRDPQRPEGVRVKLEIEDCSCVTSGGYERYLEVDGERYSHIIDKDTNWPARYWGSVTVICEDSAVADALATALFCMDYEHGRALVDALDGVQCIWICEDGQVLCSEGLEGKLVML